MSFRPQPAGSTAVLGNSLFGGQRTNAAVYRVFDSLPTDKPTLALLSDAGAYNQSVAAQPQASFDPTSADPSANWASQVLPGATSNDGVRLKVQPAAPQAAQDNKRALYNSSRQHSTSGQLPPLPHAGHPQVNKSLYSKSYATAPVPAPEARPAVKQSMTVDMDELLRQASAVSTAGKGGYSSGPIAAAARGEGSASLYGTARSAQTAATATSAPAAPQLSAAEKHAALLQQQAANAAALYQKQQQAQAQQQRQQAAYQQQQVLGQKRQHSGAVPSHAAMHAPMQLSPVGHSSHDEYLDQENTTPPAQNHSHSSGEDTTHYLECDEDEVLDDEEHELDRDSAESTLHCAAAQQQQQQQQRHRPMASIHTAVVYSGVGSSEALALANELLAKYSLPGGVTFMPMSSNSWVFHVCKSWGFTSYAIALGNTYFMRLLTSVSALGAAVRADPEFADYVRYLKPSVKALEAPKEEGSYGGSVALRSIQFTCVYLATKVIDRMPALEMLRFMLGKLYGSVVERYQAYEIEVRCLEGLKWRLGPYFDYHDLSEEMWPVA